MARACRDIVVEIAFVMNSDMAQWSSDIAHWAADQPLIEAVYAFGSRVKGGYRPDSDIDLAIEVGGEDEQDCFTNAIFFKGEWAIALQSLVSVAVHLQIILPDDIIVKPAVLDHGQLLYRRV